MKKLHLNYDELIQGDFKLNKLNVLLVFQVNCPGCFHYALPLFNRLYKDFINYENVSFLGLSTAFENYDKNNLTNTKALIHHGELIGEAKSFMTQQGFDKLPYTIKFPVAMDTFDQELNNIDTDIAFICNQHSDYDSLSEIEKKQFTEKVKNYLNNLQKYSRTFTLNQFQGTPSFVLFNDQYEILNQYFGRISYNTIANKITGKNTM